MALTENTGSSFDDRVRLINGTKHIFTPGPASLTSENLQGLGPCFGRGDADYEATEQVVLRNILKICGQSQIARMQGSGTLALEIVALNFLYGRIIVVETGYYSNRLAELCRLAQLSGQEITEIVRIPSQAIGEVKVNADWVWGCPVETSVGLRTPIRALHDLASRCGAKLALDATASIGLETDHALADVTSFSSCKGLFGLTGASFIGFSESPNNSVSSFYMDLSSHVNRQMTGPYHAIQSLAHVLPVHDSMVQSVRTNRERFARRFEPFLTRPQENQPLICTQVSIPLRSRSGRGILYSPRTPQSGAVVSHLGEVHLGKQAKGDIVDDLDFE